MSGSKGKTIRRIILIVLAAVFLITATVFSVIVFTSRPAVQTAETYQKTYPGTVITVAEDGGVEILPENGTGDKPGIIFYVGAQIRPEAYIPLLARLAQKGYPCFIPSLSCNISLMEPAAAEPIMCAHPEIGSWYLAGHSLGGFTASGFVDDHRDEADGLILVASYPNRDLSSTNLPVLSVYGDTDGVLNKTRYDERKEWCPADFEEYVISGANHAQFGDYGKQPRDNDARITSEQQQEQTAEIILDWLSRQRKQQAISGGAYGL